MRRVSVVAAVSTATAGVLGLLWFGLFLAQPVLGYEDTDDPASGVRFVREHPQLFAQTGLVLILMALVLVVAVASVAELHRQLSPRWSISATTAFGMFAGLCFLVFGAMRIGASGPLLHIAGLRQEWGEAAYLVVQMAGVQGVLPAGMLSLAVWAVGLSVTGIRHGTVPRAVCVLGVVPALHVVGRIVGQVGGPLPDWAWTVLIVSIPGTLGWCIALGVGLLVRLRRDVRA
ncbi:MAG TPA: hypothetical protein VFW55_12925 [Propionicimonas sp.]|nr:hypothetical protein [Propionicimonas sp.]